MKRCSVQASLKPRLDMAFKCFALPLLILLLLPSFSLANIYRCVSDSGVVTYSDEPCGNNAVVAFEAHKMGVEGAAGKDVIRPNTNRASYEELEKDIIDHAKRIGTCILPDKKINGYSIVKGSKTYDVIDWTVSEEFGSDNNKGQWQITITYQGKIITDKHRRSRTMNTIKLKTIMVSKGGQPSDPPSMDNLRTFRKTHKGNWQYLR